MGNKKRQPTYSWREGYAVRGLEPQDAAAELARIRDVRGGKLNPAAVVEEARPEDAPLHPAFEWDDAVAAEKHRKWQARKLIRSIQVIYEPGGPREPVYYHVSIESGNRRDRFYQTAGGLRLNQDQYAAAAAELSSKVEQAQHASSTLRRVIEGDGSPDTHRLALLAALAESLSTARNISDRLQ